MTLEGDDNAATRNEMALLEKELRRDRSGSAVAATLRQFMPPPQPELRVSTWRAFIARL